MLTGAHLWGSFDDNTTLAWICVGIEGKMTTPSFPDDLQSWIVKTHPAIWKEWLVNPCLELEFDDWITAEHYNVYCAYDEYLGQASE